MKKYKMKINGQNYEARIVEYSDTVAKITVNGIDFDIEFESDEISKTPQIIQVERPMPAPVETQKEVSSEKEVKAPIPGVVISIKVNEGDTVKTGDILLTLEAMKMESEIVSPIDGNIEKVLIKERATVQEGDVLIKIVTNL